MFQSVHFQNWSVLCQKASRHYVYSPNWIAVYRKASCFFTSKTGAPFTKKLRHTVLYVCKTDRCLPKSFMLQSAHFRNWIVFTENWIAVYRKASRHSMPVPKPGSLFTEKRQDTVSQFPNLDLCLPKSVTTRYANSQTWLAGYRKSSRHSMPMPEPWSLVTEKRHDTVCQFPHLDRCLPKSVTAQYACSQTWIAGYRKVSCYSIFSSKIGAPFTEQHQHTVLYIRKTEALFTKKLQDTVLHIRKTEAPFTEKRRHTVLYICKTEALFTGGLHDGHRQHCVF